MFTFLGLHPSDMQFFGYCSSQIRPKDLGVKQRSFKEIILHPEDTEKRELDELLMKLEELLKQERQNQKQILVEMNDVLGILKDQEASPIFVSIIETFLKGFLQIGKNRVDIMETNRDLLKAMHSLDQRLLFLEETFSGLHEHK